MTTPGLEERAIGTVELLERLAEDPFGTVHRGLEWTAPRATRSVLVRQYHPAWQDLGLATRRHEILRHLVHLGHLAPYKGCHLGRDGSLRLLWPYAAGRSLAQTLRAADAQGLSFGMDQALFLVWALSHHLRHLHEVQLSAGFLAPHRIWIGFDGWVQLLDMPVIDLLQELLPGVPSAAQLVEPYRRGPAGPGLASDAFQLGALLFETLTHRPLDVTRPIPATLETARLHLPEGETDAIPEPVLALLQRLLRCTTPFRTLQELEHTLASSLYGGEFDPTTFGLAFAMQTIFRHEMAAATVVPDEEPSAPRPGPSAPGPRPWKRNLRYPLAAVGLIATGGLAWVAGWGSRSPQAPIARVSPIHVVAKAPVALERPATALSEAPHPPPPPPPPPAPVATKAAPVPVRLRIFVDEQGRVRQAHLLSGAVEGSAREQAACALAMAKTFPGASSTRSWGEITVLVP